jgi:hypothetical protein
LSDSDATFQQEGADLVDNAGALTDEPFTHSMHGLQIELIGGLRRHERHRWPLSAATSCTSFSRWSFALATSPARSAAGAAPARPWNRLGAELSERSYSISACAALI